MEHERVVVIFSGGGPARPGAAQLIPDGAFLIAADSGLDLALALGVRVDLVVGDLDSASTGALTRARDQGVTVNQFPRDKDETDLALALDAARDSGATSVLVLGGGGGRLDHLLAGALLLGSPDYVRLHIDAWFGPARLQPMHGGERLEITGSPGDFVSLLPVGGHALGVRTDGLRFPLHGETLLTGSTRGVSNELVATRGCVQLDTGTLIVIQPGAVEGDR